MIRKVLDKGDGEFTWIDIVSPSEDELFQVARDFSLHQDLVSDCLQPDHLPKYEIDDGTEFFIVRHYDTEAAHDADTVRGLTRKIAVFYGKNFILTVHRTEHEFFLALQQQWASDPGPVDPFRVLCSILSAALITYAPHITALVSEVEDFEKKIFSGSAPSLLIQEIYRVKRRTSVMGRIIHLTIDLLDKIARPHGAGGPVLSDVRDTARHLYFYTVQLQENINNLLNLQITLASFKTSEVMRVLTLFSVFFMPLTFLAGVYGMNFKFMPELGHPYGYPLVLLFMLLVTLGIYKWFKRKKWL